MSGSVRNVLVQDCVMEHGNQGAVRMKLQSGRGGSIKNITFRRIRPEHSASFLDITMRCCSVQVAEPLHLQHARIRE